MTKISRTNAWLLATRPKTLPAAIGPVAVGTAAAATVGGMHLPSAVSALFTAVLLQIAVNLANDFFDAKAGHDTKERLGPVRVTQSGLIPPWQVMGAMALCLGLAVATGLYLLIRGGIPAMGIALFCIAGVLTYSGGPWPLAENGLGDIAAFVFFGPIAVCGTAWVQALQLPPAAMTAAIPTGFLVTAIICVNNTRDITTDKKTGKNTLAVRIGPIPSRYEFTALVATAYLFPLFLAATGNRWMLLTLLSFPKALVTIQEIWHVDGILLNDVLADTAKLSLLFSLLYALALGIGG